MVGTFGETGRTANQSLGGGVGRVGQSEKTEEENWLTLHALLSRTSPAVICTCQALKPLDLFAVRSAPACSNELLRLLKTQIKPPF